MKKLIITEKPSVAMQFKNALKISCNEKQDGFIEDDNWVITWCIGHLVALVYPENYNEKYKKWSLEDLPFLPDEYQYGVISSVKNQYKTVYNLLHRTDIDVVYWAGDSGREGQVIEENIRRFGGVRQGIKELRVWIDSQTDKAILQGIKEVKPMSAYENLAASGTMRAIEDYAMGINFSRVLTLLYGTMINRAIGSEQYIPISVGRVMTCVLGMVVDKERSIRGFKETLFYKVVGEFGGVQINAEWKDSEHSIYHQSPKLYKDIGFTERKEADRLIEWLTGKPAYVEDITSATSKKNPPYLFNLAELQSYCSKKFKISPNETLAVAQSLYEKKLTTYPRTDARVLSSSIAVEIENNLKGLNKGYHLSNITSTILEEGSFRMIGKTRYTDDSKVTDHYAIIPTGDLSGYDGLNELEKKIFECIVRRFLAIFFPPAIYKTTKIDFRVEKEHFYTSAKALIELGYIYVMNGQEEEKETEENNSNDTVKDLDKIFKKGDIVALKQLFIKEGKTTPPVRYTSGSIILAMENAGQLIEDEELRSQIKSTGIGTSATRGDILYKLIKNGYIRLNEKTQVLEPQNLGEMIYEVVKCNLPELLNPKLSALWDRELEEISQGKIGFGTYKIKMDTYIRENVQRMIQTKPDVKEKISVFAIGGEISDEKKPIGTCPNCKGDILIGKFGLYCKNKCGLSLSNVYALGKLLTMEQTKSILEGKKVLLKGLVSKNKGTTYEAYVSFDGIEECVYRNKEGQMIQGKRIKFKVDFPKRKQ